MHDAPETQAAMNDSRFSLHPQLRRDFKVLGRTGPSWLLLRNNAALPWFLLVPETECTEIFELPATTREALRHQMDVLAAFVKQHFKADKINVAAIGNVVPQLHVHVIARRRDDCCWPQAAWGHVEVEASWSAAELTRLDTALDALAALPLDRKVPVP